MSADVRTVITHQAYCEKCGWRASQRSSESAADWDADQHDRERHPIEPPARP